MRKSILSRELHDAAHLTMVGLFFLSGRLTVSWCSSAARGEAASGRVSSLHILSSEQSSDGATYADHQRFVAADARGLLSSSSAE